MMFGATTQLALAALLRNKMRSLLTMLGIVIGVAAVIMMQMMGRGATAYVGEAISGPREQHALRPARDQQGHEHRDAGRSALHRARHRRHPPPGARGLARRACRPAPDARGARGEQSHDERLRRHAGVLSDSRARRLIRADDERGRGETGRARLPRRSDDRRHALGRRQPPRSGPPAPRHLVPRGRGGGGEGVDVRQRSRRRRLPAVHDVLSTHRRERPHQLHHRERRRRRPHRRCDRGDRARSAPSPPRPSRRRRRLHRA